MIAVCVTQELEPTKPDFELYVGVRTSCSHLRLSKPEKIVPKKTAIQRAKTLAVDSAAYKNLTANQVPSDERFIHSYFNFLEKSGAKKAEDSDASVSDDEFDSYL
ncbi:unnamed protein product, partial [Dibothriocephalus latus]